MKFALVLFFLLPFVNCFSTIQVRDFIIIEGESYEFYQTFDSKNKFSEVLNNYIDKVDKYFETSIKSNCFKGYIATYEIINDSLFLIEMKTCEGKDLKRKFKKNTPDNIFIDDFEGEYYAGKEKLWYFGYGKEITLDFSSGLLINKKIFSTDFKSVEKLNNLIISNLKERLKPKLFKKILKNKTFFTFTIEERTSEVKIVDIDTGWGEKVLDEIDIIQIKNICREFSFFPQAFFTGQKTDYKYYFNT